MNNFGFLLKLAEIYGKDLYKVIGDKNHLDTEAESIEVKIDKANPQLMLLVMLFAAVNIALIAAIKAKKGRDSEENHE